jgi:hypothetical protein
MTRASWENGILRNVIDRIMSNFDVGVRYGLIDNAYSIIYSFMDLIVDFV